MKLSAIFNFWKKVNRTSDCWLWTGGKINSGYGKYSVPKIGITRTHMLAHRMAWILFNGEIPDGLDILHSCDVKLCCNPSHLKPGTRSENMKDAALKKKMKQSL